MKNKIVRTLLFLLLCHIGCEPAWEEPFLIYTIKKGNHTSTFKVSSLQSETLSFSAIFDQTAVYQSTIEENQHDINKLLGFSDCNSFHHDNSARFGWRWLDGQLQIHAYCYVNGERKTAFIGTVELDEEARYAVHVSDTEYVFYLNDLNPVSISRGNVCNIGVYYMLYPYFGGNETAPHDISIRIKMTY